MPEVFEGEEWLTMADAAREIGVGYNIITNYVHYYRGLESRTVGFQRYVKRAELLAKAPEIREYANTRQKRKRRVPA